MDIQWTKGLRGKEKTDREQFVKTNSGILELLKEILEQQSQGTVEPDYDSPSWAYKQADRNGRITMLKKIIKLITID